MNKDSKIYVAGHKGLVGSAIWKELESKGYTNLVGRTHKELDLTESSFVRNFFYDEKPEYVFLAAAYVGGIVANNTYRADFIFRNLQIQNNVIGESFRHNVKKLLFLGSTCIYPKEAPQPMKEDYLLTSPLEYTNEPYAIAKIAGIKLCESFNLQYGTNFISIMPTNLYGPNDNFDLENSHVLPALIRKIFLAKCLHDNSWSTLSKDITKRPIDGLNEKSDIDTIIRVLGQYGIASSHVELWGSGKPMREFLWSEDMAEASVFVMENVNFHDLTNGKKEIRNCHINIGTGKEVSIKSLACSIADILGYRGNIKFDSTKPDGTMRKLTDVSKLNALGWQHKVEIGEGINMLYDWYKNDIEQI